MECYLEAHPLPEIAWYHADNKITDQNERIKMSRKAISKDTYILKLEISGPQQQDGGSYRCNAFNLYGESNANIALNFQGGYQRNRELYENHNLNCYSTMKQIEND